MTKRKDPPGYPSDEAIKKQFGEALRKLRMEKGLSLEDVDALLQQTQHHRPHPQWPRALRIVTRRLREGKGLSRAQLGNSSGLPLRNHQQRRARESKRHQPDSTCTRCNGTGAFR
jgi:hypothetical protein